MTHPLLNEQIKEYLPERLQKDADLSAFLQAVDRIYSDEIKIKKPEEIDSDKQDRFYEYTRQLEKINKELDQFAYIVSHDLKAPLRAITNLSEWIEEDLGEKIDEETQKNFSLLRSRIKRMESLISGILAYSRAGRIKTENQEIELNTFLQEIISNLSPPENFIIDQGDNMPTIYTEKIALDQVLSNLLSNAIKYNTSDNPTIKIHVDEKNNEYEFCVEDNGPGIDEQFHEKIFMIFQTLQSRDILESTGVGLAIVKKIISDKGGKIWIMSSPGSGAKFFFTMPKIKNQTN